MVLARLTEKLDAPVDGASIAAFRVLFGALMVALSVRFFTHGWIELDYGRPRHFLHYWGFGWVTPLPLAWMYVHYAVMGVAATCVLLGVFYRAALAVFVALHAYAHLIDKSNYLNHYYLIFLVGAILLLIPADRQGSLRVARRPDERRRAVRAWMVLALRFQIGVVYVFGGIGKLGSDWLIHGEPLRIWLSANAELPILGRYFDRPGAAIALSWAGLFFDLGIVPLLLWRRTRVPAYVAVASFHVLTALLFNIGLFPWLMMAGATLFFDPAWPRRLFGRSAPALDRADVAGPPIGKAGLGVASAYVVVQVLMPLRSLAYPGNTLWSEEGFRFAWKVMLIEKSGELELRVVDREGQTTWVDPATYLTPFQKRQVATQPDMILETAHLVAADLERRGRGPVSVFAKSSVSFNGRPRAPMIDPEVDLAREEDGLAPKRWIQPAPTTAPRF